MKLTSELPLYESIKRGLQARIESGELPEGARILPEIELAHQSGVSRSTARKALQALEMEGYLSRTAGRGSFVKPRHRGEAGALEERGSVRSRWGGPPRDFSSGASNSRTGIGNMCGWTLI